MHTELAANYSAGVSIGSADSSLGKFDDLDDCSGRGNGGKMRVNEEQRNYYSLYFNGLLLRPFTYFNLKSMSTQQECFT